MKYFKDFKAFLKSYFEFGQNLKNDWKNPLSVSAENVFFRKFLEGENPICVFCLFFLLHFSIKIGRAQRGKCVFAFRILLLGLKIFGRENRIFSSKNRTFISLLKFILFCLNRILFPFQKL